MQKIVYFDSYHLFITNKADSFNKLNYTIILTDEEKVFDFRTDPSMLFNGFKGNIALVTPFVEEALESIFDFADGIVAAGGIIKNAAGKVLTIYRRGFWDLPKGKVEAGEKIEDAALREVKEETGADVVRASHRTIVTYHCYVIKGENCIKETHWYLMNLVGTNTLEPQTEEDIESIEWMNKEEFESKKALFYPLISSLLTDYFSK
ncbi:MAG: NUDIX domain-containing protein [Chitinophagales bacterium]|jgi:8-oxo-dGTP pyrophosphatase MutT (NUDIX family)|nr:NUDIX domain-containing protein [Chitinophagales bacterium]